MSALGQKQTCAAHNGMSALPPIATVKADIRNASCPLYPESGYVQCTGACPLRAKSGQNETCSHRRAASQGLWSYIFELLLYKLVGFDEPVGKAG